MRDTKRRRELGVKEGGKEEREIVESLSCAAPGDARCLPGRWLAQRAILAEAPSR